MDTPGENEKKINDVIAAWEKHAPSATFAKMTLPQFKAAVKDAQDRRTEIKNKEVELTALQNRRDDADRIALPLCDKVVKAVVGDTDYGDDSDLYEAMGYVRKSERKTGLTRKKNGGGPATPTR